MSMFQEREISSKSRKKESKKGGLGSRFFFKIKSKKTEKNLFTATTCFTPNSTKHYQPFHNNMHSETPAEDENRLI
jgi:hypothetical protein